MRYKSLFFVIILIFAAGCATAPESVPDRYVVHSEKQQGDRLTHLEEEIIQRRQEKDVAKHDLEVSGQQLKVLKANKLALDAHKKFLLEQLEFYTLTNDIAKLNHIRLDVQEVEKNIKNNEKLLQYGDVDLQYSELQLRLRDAQLQALVAQREYARAEIASEYLRSVTPGTGETGKETKIDLQDYEIYMNSKLENLETIQEEFDDLSKRRNDLRASLPVQRW